jgi:hypothetical protein
MRFPCCADTSTRDNDLDAVFLFADGRRLLDDERGLAFNGSWFLDAISFLDVLIRRQDGPTGDR